MNFTDGFAVVRINDNDEINQVMASFTDIGDANTYMEECYKDDYDELKMPDESWNEYRSCPANRYAVECVPILIHEAKQ